MAEASQALPGWYEREFRLAFHTKKATEFQDWFAALMALAHREDFQPVRPYGKIGDLKCDGYLPSTRTIFQVYAPYDMNLAELQRKIAEDFMGAKGHWGERMRRWVFVHNDPRGLPAPATHLLDDLARQHAPVLVTTWAEAELLQIMRRLSLHDLVYFFGPAPTVRDMEQLGLETLRVVLSAIARREPHQSCAIEPVSPAKLEANALSSDCAHLLHAGRRREALVEQFFAGWHDPTLGEDIAEAFRSRYVELRDQRVPPDDIFRALQDLAGGGRRGSPSHEAAVLAVLAYFFERCDIFEAPRLGAASP